jgi:hypothetical protein
MPYSNLGTTRISASPSVTGQTPHLENEPVASWGTLICSRFCCNYWFDLIAYTILQKGPRIGLRAWTYQADRWRLKSALANSTRSFPSPLVSKFVALLSRKETTKYHTVAPKTQWKDDRMESLNIQQLASQCAALFKTRLKAGYIDAGDEEIEEKDILETQYARFNLWADNIGR